MTPMYKVLVVNPNSSVSVTHTVKTGLEKLDAINLDLTYWTSSTSPALIKNAADMAESTAQCIPDLLPLIDQYDGFLAVCYADHPIVEALQALAGVKPVVGIFDASIAAALSLTEHGSKFGILTTGQPFEDLLTDGVRRLLGPHQELMRSFGGVVASRVGISDLSPDQSVLMYSKISRAVSKLLTDETLDVICVGGAILCGLETLVQQIANDKGRSIEVVDQLAAGLSLLTIRLHQSRSLVALQDAEVVTALQPVPTSYRTALLTTV